MKKPFDITIAGELNLDLILYGLPAHMQLEVEILASGFRATLGSSSAIVAHNAALLGARVAFTSLIGTDDFGSIALRRLTAAGVDTSHVLRHDTLPTGVTILLPHGAERHILTYPGTIAELTIADLDLDFLTQARHFHLSSLYLQRGLHAGLPDLFRHLKQAGLTISMDTNDDPEDHWSAPLYDLLPYVDIFLPSESEILRITKAADVHSAIAALSSKVPTIIVKRGPRGALVHHTGHNTEVPPLTVVPVDTIGAGDSFDAGFLRAFLEGKDIITCAQAGNITGALSTQSSGGTEAFLDTRLRGSFLSQYNFFDLLV